MCRAQQRPGSYAEFITRTRFLTKLRVFRDRRFPAGSKIEVGPFPGWAEVPEW